jgi:Domain of unknown function (DUF4292)
MKQMSIKLLRPGILLFILLLSGCARPLPPEVSLPLRSESQLRAQLEVVTRRYQSLQTSAKIEVATDKETFAASQVLFVERPARLRSEILFGPFATPVLSLSINEDKLSVYQPLKGTFAEGSASVANIARFTRMPLRAEDLVGMILVAPPSFPFEQSSASRTVAGDRLDLMAAGGVEQHFTFDAAGNLLQATYLLEERLQLQIDYSGFAAQQGDFPQRLQVSIPERQVVAIMTFSDSVVNVPIPPKNFILKIPAGMKVQALP